MPKYTFKCNTCSVQRQVCVSRTITSIVCECGSNMGRLLPTLNKGVTNECVDKYLNKRAMDGQSDHLKERSERYYWSVEVPRFVQSGQYSIETMLDNGWIYFDDSKTMKTHTKPPSER